MRAPLIALIAAALLAAAFFVLRPGGAPAPEPAPTIERPSEEPTDAGAPEGDVDLQIAAPAEEREVPPEDLTPEPSGPPGPLASFHGEVLLQHPGTRPQPAATGTIEFQVLSGRYQARETALVQGGRFQVEIPEIARVMITGGTLEGLAVRYLGVDRPFDPTGDHYVLVGEPIPVNVLVPLDAVSGTPLAGVDLRVGENSTAARLVAAADSPGAAEPADDARQPPPLMRDAASPITLPFLDADHAVWIHVQKDGYASASVLVDPSVPARREVRLWPAAQLTVRLTGRARTQAQALVLMREESADRAPHAATFPIGAPGVERTNDAIVFAIDGLGARPHRIEVKGYDGRGRSTTLAKQRVELVAGETANATVFLDAQ